jgi:gas vesicle protein
MQTIQFSTSKTNTMANNAGSVIAGVLAGLAAGTLIGILVAPDKGSNTRQKIVDGANEIGKRFGDQMQDLAGSARKFKRDVKQSSQEMRDDVQHTIDNLREA